MKLSPKLVGFLEAVALVCYILIFALSVNRASQIFANFHPNPAVSIIMFLLLFVISALISGALVLGYPILLFFADKKNAAVRVFVWSALWLIVFLIIIGSIVLWYFLR